MRIVIYSLTIFGGFIAQDTEDEKPDGDRERNTSLKGSPAVTGYQVIQSHVFGEHHPVDVL